MDQPSGRVQLVLAVVATTAVAFLSYFVVRKRGIQGKSSPVPEKSLNRVKRNDVTNDSIDEKLVADVGASQSSQVPQELKTSGQGRQLEDEEGNGLGDSKRTEGDEGQNQTSFIVIDNGEGAVPPDNEQSKKKSDRSSDESSYDVIDDDQLVDEGNGSGSSERDESGHTLEDVSEHKQDPFLDSGETSMVVIEDLNQSNTEDLNQSDFSKSGSSFYASADEGVLWEKDEEEKKMKLSYVQEEGDISSLDIDVSKTPSREADVSSSPEKSSVEESQAVASPDHVQETEKPLLTDDPDPVSEESFPLEERGNETSSDNLLQQSESDTRQEPAPISAEEITEVLNQCQNSPSTVSKENIHLLVNILQKKIPELHSTVLNSVLRVAAFTQNVKTLQESGCLKVVADQTLEACKSISGGDVEAGVLNSLCQVLTNLSLDPKYHAELQDTIPALIDLLVSSDQEAVKLSVLRPLINFSSQASYHGHYTHAIQLLYTLLDKGSSIAKVQSLKVLVNLSLDEAMVPHLLAAKAPVRLLELLDVPSSTDIILRTLTFLANIKAATQKGNVTLASLPLGDKAASPETMFMALNSVERIPTLRSKVFRLTRHNNEDVSHQASRFHKYIQEMSG